MSAKVIKLNDFRKPTIEDRFIAPLNLSPDQPLSITFPGEMVRDIAILLSDVRDNLCFDVYPRYQRQHGLALHCLARVTEMLAKSCRGVRGLNGSTE